MSELYELLRKLGGDYHVEGTAFLAEPHRTEELEKILEQCVRRGWVDKARRTADIIGRALTTDEVTNMLVKSVDELRIDQAREAAAMLPEPQRTEELEKILATCMDNGWLTDARKIADILLKRP